MIPILLRMDRNRFALSGLRVDVSSRKDDTIFISFD